MANILFLTPDKSDPCSFYRCGGIARDLEKKSDHIITTINWNQVSLDWQFLSSFDIVMLQRPFTKTAEQLCQYIKNMGKPLWVDYDDNLFAVNPENRTYMTYNAPDVQENIKSILKLADVVSVPLEYLRSAYGPYNKNLVVIPNAFNDDIFKRPDILKKRTKTVVWRGPGDHIYDLMTFGKEINRCAEGFPDHEFIFMGYYPWFLSETQNKGYLPCLDIIMYHHKLVELAPMAMHVPLHDNTFNRSRSNTAYLEITQAGGVCINPDWWSVPGSVPYTDVASYYEALRSVLSGEIDIEVNNRMAQEYINDCLRLSQVNVLRLNVLNELL